MTDRKSISIEELAKQLDEYEATLCGEAPQPFALPFIKAMTDSKFFDDIHDTMKDMLEDVFHPCLVPIDGEKLRKVIEAMALVMLMGTRISARQQLEEAKQGLAAMMRGDS